MEVEAMGAVGVPFFAMGIAVGVSLALPGFKSDMTKGMLGALPQVCALVVSQAGTHAGTCQKPAADRHSATCKSDLRVSCTVHARSPWPILP